MSTQPWLPTYDPTLAAWLKEQKARIENINPCIRTYGADPKGRLCRQCKLLRRVEYHGKVYFKCAKRGDTRSISTDHRGKWSACMEFVPIRQKDPNFEPF